MICCTFKQAQKISQNITQYHKLFSSEPLLDWKMRQTIVFMVWAVENNATIKIPIWSFLLMLPWKVHSGKRWNVDCVNLNICQYQVSNFSSIFHINTVIRILVELSPQYTDQSWRRSSQKQGCTKNLPSWGHIIHIPSQKGEEDEEKEEQDGHAGPADSSNARRAWRGEQAWKWKWTSRAIILTSVEISIYFPQVEMLVDLEEANTVEPVVATRKPVLERPTEEVPHQSFCNFTLQALHERATGEVSQLSLPFLVLSYLTISHRRSFSHGTYLPSISRLISAWSKRFDQELETGTRVQFYQNKKQQWAYHGIIKIYPCNLINCQLMSSLCLVHNSGRSSIKRRDNGSS